MLSAAEAMQRLEEGNRRFVKVLKGEASEPCVTRRHELLEQQAPFAIILGCSDSRVPLEIVFDQGVGDLFVIRVAGNIVAPSQIGSVEYAAEAFGTRLVVVLGHSRCGAVDATLEQLERLSEQHSRHLQSIVDRIRPAVQPLYELGKDMDRAVLMEHAVRANVMASADRLRNGSPLLEDLIVNKGLRVVGAEYSLETGKVEFIDGVSAVETG